MSQTLTNLNYATNTRGVLEIHRAPEVSFTATNFQIPGISTVSPLQPTPFTDFPIHGDKLTYSPLTMSFIVTEDLKNWRLLILWMYSFTNPIDFENWDDSNEKYSDATIFMYNSHNNLEIEILFKELIITSIDGLTFDTTSESTDELICTVTFDYQNYDIVAIKRLNK